MHSRRCSKNNFESRNRFGFVVCGYYFTKKLHKKPCSKLGLFFSCSELHRSQLEIELKMASLEGADIWGSEDPLAQMEVDSMTTEELRQRRMMIENEIRIFQGEERRIDFETRTQKAAIKENKEKIKLNKSLPWLVANVVEVYPNFQKV